MSPTSDEKKENVRTVGCALEKLVPNATHLDKIRHVPHKATILASELLNIYLSVKTWTRMGTKVIPEQTCDEF